MINKITERISFKKNDEIKNWYQAKLKEAAYFLLKQIKPAEKVMPFEKRELEVMVK